MKIQTNIASQQQQYDQQASIATGGARLDTIFKQLPVLSNMKSKFDKIADLFEMDVLSEDEALKACKTVIQQHAKKNGKVGEPRND